MDGIDLLCTLYCSLQFCGWGLAAVINSTLSEASFDIIEYNSETCVEESTLLKIFGASFSARFFFGKFLLHLFEEMVEDGSEKERQGLRDDEAADNRKSETFMILCHRSANTERDRHCAHHGCDGRHQDRTETDAAGFDDRIIAAFPFLLPLFDGEINHQDSVF